MPVEETAVVASFTFTYLVVRLLKATVRLKDRRLITVLLQKLRQVNALPLHVLPKRARSSVTAVIPPIWSN